MISDDRPPAHHGRPHAEPMIALLADRGVEHAVAEVPLQSPLTPNTPPGRATSSPLEQGFGQDSSPCAARR